ncbi:MAG TPA: mandelate racemase/muconate lactonizing enzyme family protein [Xanthomonadales bacterium]|nr:mandelate racemase/muconate lactonizing enzyme family protein [Xanthomonadales bacterium]
MTRPTDIRELRCFAARSPLSRPIADATHVIPAIEFVVCEIELRNGVVGQSYLLAFHYSPRGIRGVLRDLADFARGRDAAATQPFIRDWNRETEYFGQEGLQRWALGLANVAMWDAHARTLDVPVWRLLGGEARAVPVYGSGGWLSYSDDELVDEVRGYAKRGFRAVKVKVGAPEPGRDLARLRLVREAVGPHVRIMMDANQGMRVPEALELALASRDIGIGWFEEPIDHRDFDGYASLRARAGVALAMGEREYDLVPLRELLARNALDLWQPDLLRLGSVEAWRDSAALAAAHAVPVLPHYYRDYDVPLLCTVANAYGAESFDWIDAIVDVPMRVENGLARPRETAGWGFRFQPSALTAL